MIMKSVFALQFVMIATLVSSLAIIAIHTIHSAEAAAGRIRNDCVPRSGSGNNVYVSWFSIKE
jgi:hypothetical protein